MESSVAKLEIIAFNIASCEIAQAAGAARIELCDNPADGAKGAHDRTDRRAVATTWPRPTRCSGSRGSAERARNARPGYPAAAAEDATAAEAFPGNRERAKRKDGREGFPKPSSQARSGYGPVRRVLERHLGDVGFMRKL